MREEIAGFLVLGPDYFFGIPVQNLPPDRDKVAWSLEARTAAIDVFPKWFEQVKSMHGWTPPISHSPDTLLNCVCCIGTETTKYVAVGKCPAEPHFVRGSMICVSRLLFWCTIRVRSGRRGVHHGR